MPFVFLAFVLVPLAEIAVFVEVGGIIGLWPTLGVVVLTAFLGTGLLRAQGLAAFGRAQAAMAEGRLPVEEVVHGFCLVIAGALLLTPGFLTDAVGFALFVPPVRLALGRAALRWMSKHGTVHVYTNEGPRRAPQSEPGVVDGEAEEVETPRNDNEPEAHDPDRPTPWTPPRP
ncbi:MAG: FxsA family protein [Parvibaculaceae bacterium]